MNDNVFLIHSWFPHLDPFFVFWGLFFFSSCMYFYWTGPMPLDMAYIPNLFKWKIYFHKWNGWLYPRVTWNCLRENDIFVDVDFQASMFKFKQKIGSSFFNSFDNFFVSQCMHSIKMFHLGFTHYYYETTDWLFDTYTFWIHFRSYELFYFFMF